MKSGKLLRMPEEGQVETIDQYYRARGSVEEARQGTSMSKMQQFRHKIALLQ
jgi:hypothetical protein